MTNKLRVGEAAPEPQATAPHVLYEPDGDAPRCLNCGLGKQWWASLPKCRWGAEAHPAGGTPPQHPFEVTIRIGANDWDYVSRTLEELSYHLKEHGPECNLASGGWDGGHSVEVKHRAISADDFRKELIAWRETK